MATRATTDRKRAEREAIRSLINAEIAEEDYAHPEKTAAHYLRLTKERKRLSELNKEIQQHTTPAEFTEEIRTSEVTDASCLWKCEILLGKLPENHHLRRHEIPVHIQMDLLERHQQRPTERHPLRQPSIEKFDGKGTTSWKIWKAVFDREVHHNPDLSLEDKFILLIDSLEKGSFPRHLTEQYAGLPGAYTLAYQDLVHRYERKEDLHKRHLTALINLPKNFTVTDTRSAFQLERLHQEVNTRVNMLNGLGVAEGQYQQVAVIGVENCLPGDLRAKLQASVPQTGDQGDGRTELSRLLRFIDNEAKTWRTIGELSPGHRPPSQRKRFEGGSQQRRYQGGARSATLMMEEDNRHPLN